jgi:serine/threonine-protein kinase
MADRIPRATDATGLLLGDLPAGARVGDYVIKGPLATRGNGHLYEAVHLVLPRRATVKVLPGDQSTLAMGLLREACIVDALDHPGIPRIYECGVLPDRRPWIATEQIEGTSLAVTLARGSISVAEITTIIRDVADILDHAHRRGLVHRNVVPAAIIRPEPERRFPFCLVDWSGARAHDSTSPIPMFPLVSSRPYLAPEQLAGQATDGRADVYALGVIARELLRCARLGSTPPVLVSLIQDMIDPNPSRRPTSHQVHDATMWLAAQIDADAVPREIDIGETEPVSSPMLRAVTSEIAPFAAGEITHRTRS